MNQLKLKEGINEIDQNISKMFLITKSMKQDYHFNMLIKKKGELNPDQYLWLEYARLKMEKDSLIYTFPSYSFLLFRECDAYISPSQSSADFQKFYGKFLKLEGSSFDTAYDFKESLFNAPGIYSFQKAGSISYVSNGKVNTIDNAILCTVKGTSDYTNTASHVMTYVIDPGILVKLLLTEETVGRGLVQIEDMRSGDILLNYGTDTPLPDQAEVGEKIQVNGIGYFLASYETKEAGWRVTIGFPQSIVDDQVRSITNMILLYICVGITIVLLLTFYFSYRQYMDIRKLFVTISGEGGTLSRGQNEYEVLRCILKDVTQNRNEYKYQMENLNRQNQALMLENLIVRGINTKEERAVFEKCFDKPFKYFCVVLLRMQAEESSQYQIALLCINEYLKESYPNDFANVHTGIWDELFLISLNPLDASNVSHIKDMFENIMMVLADDMSILFHVGISAIGTDISNIHVCYNQAQQVIQAYGSEAVNTIEIYSININSARENVIDVEYLNKLYNLILCGEREAIEQQFARISVYYQKVPFQYDVQKQQIFYTVRNVIYSAYLHLVTNPQDADIIPDYHSGYTLKEMITVLCGSALEVCDYMEEKKRSRNNVLKERILAYIREHYTDPSITASGVSHEMRISEKYLSQFMKEQTGETFASYLEHLRIEKAKEHLEHSDMSNEKIAELTGFGAMNTFYRAFHKHTGVSPGTYRGACRHKQDTI